MEQELQTCELSYGCWESTLSPRQEHQVLRIAEPVLQHQYFVRLYLFNVCIVLACGRSSTHMEVRGQLGGGGSLLLPRGLPGW